MVKYLVRIHHPNMDKQNIWTESWFEALELIGKKDTDITQEVMLFEGVDIFFKDTKDYIRKVKFNK